MEIEGNQSLFIYCIIHIHLKTILNFFKLPMFIQNVLNIW